MAENFPGCVQASVAEVAKDGTAFIRVHIPVIAEPKSREWFVPACNPGSGSAGRGSFYPPPNIGSVVFVIFEMGDPTAGGIWFPGGFGIARGIVAGLSTHEQRGMDVQALYRVTLWEDDYVRCFAEFDPPNKYQNQRRFVIEDKNRETAIILDAAGGLQRKSSKISIMGASGIDISCGGHVDIRGKSVSIQGRRVNPYRKGDV